jgi:hypothetical protein
VTARLNTRSRTPDQLERTINRACAAILRIAPTTDQAEEYVWSVSDRAMQGPAGRGDRLTIAVNDLFEARALAESRSPADQALAYTTFHNAIWHAGRIAATYDADGPLHRALAQVIEQDIVSQAPAIVDDLHRRGLLNDEQHAKLAPNARELARKAYLGSGGAPQWAGVMTIARSARVIDQLESIDADGPLAEARDQAIAEARRWQTNAQKFLDGKKHLAYQINKEAAGVLTRCEAVVAGLSDPRTRQINHRFAADGAIVDAHRELVSEAGKVSDKPVVAVPDKRWLVQLMDYQAQISAPSSDEVYAVHSAGAGILIAGDIAADAVRDFEAGRYSDVLVHELVHTTQPRRRAGRIRDNDHHLVELQLLEGATQALAEDLQRNARGKLRGEPTGELYAEWVAVVDAAQAVAAPDRRRDFLVGLSKTPTNSRAEYLAKTVLGDPKRRDEIIDLLAAVNEHAEANYGQPHLAERIRGFVEGQLRALRDAA